MNTLKDYTDIKNLTDEERVRFASVTIGEAGGGMNTLELAVMGRALNSFNGRPIVYVETGLGCGYSTRMPLTYIIKYGGEVHSFDIKISEILKSTMEEAGLWKYINVHQEDSRMADWPKDKHIDYLNIDSEHSLSYALSEYLRFRLCLRKTSLIGFHDTESCIGVRKAIDIIQTFDELRLFEKARKGGFGYEVYSILGRDAVKDRVKNIRIEEYER